MRPRLAAPFVLPTLALLAGAPFASGAFLSRASPLPSTSSQLTSTIGGGTTRTKLARFTASKPLPPRDVTFEEAAQEFTGLIVLEEAQW